VNTRRIFVSIILILTTLLTVAMAQAVEIYQVTSSGELAQALNEAADDDIIEIQPGTINWPNGPQIRSGITLRGSTGDPADVILDLGWVPVSLTSTEEIGLENSVQIQGLTFRNFASEDNMISVDGYLTLEDCHFLDNQAAGLITATYPLSVHNCDFQANSGDWILLSVRSLDLSESRLVANQADWIVHIMDGTLDISLSHFSENVGGLMVMSDEGGNISRTEIVGNTGGPGVTVMGSFPFPVLTMDHCTVRENILGPATLDLNICTATFTQCDIRDNYPLDGESLFPDQLTFICCDIDLGQWQLFGGEPIVDNSDCVVGTTRNTWDGMKALFLR